jgi:hypothetical protein
MRSIVLCVALLQLIPAIAHAEELENKTEILLKRGKGVVTQRAFAARADRIPADIRLGALRDGNRVRELMKTLVIRAQLAADAREAGFEKNPVVIDRMQLAAEWELADAWLDNYVFSQPEADYEALARENYLLNQQNLQSQATIDVSHILVSSEERSTEEANDLANSIRAQLEEEPGLFAELVKKHSDDPSALANKGLFENVKRGDMVKAFEETAFALKPSEISEPVKTMYGFHIIRLDAYHEPERLSFEEVRPQLVDKEREQHLLRIKQDYLGSLSALETTMPEGALEEMVRRQFGEDYQVPPTEDADSE